LSLPSTTFGDQSHGASAAPQAGVLGIEPKPLH